MLLACAVTCAGQPRTDGKPYTKQTAPAPPDRGTPTLIATTPRSTPRYDVVTPCREPGVGVIGKGSVRQPRPEVVGAPAFNNWVTALSGRVDDALGGLSVGVGWGIGCDDRAVGLRVYVPHYRDIDAAVDALAAFFEREDLGVSALVVIAVDAVPL